MEATRVEEGKGETYGWPRDMRACLGSFRRKYHRGSVEVTVMDVMRVTGIVWRYVTWVGSSWGGGGDFFAQANDQGTTWSKYWPGQRTVYLGPARSEPKLKKRRGKKDRKGKRAVH
ncbi:hypothetical protein COCMIDRAFT_32317 [Bipolaris oryzae ATCC 44560]|uniref:Uncharacterized protein n=1 Tax=Bipolaris oryzae ATCC 44560 TaxID=930090 RepID=W6ZKI6_COCMI|nr:uncharacterized protein COCMIDRAFT_32317 [Bipolaris oryzae ATCC 44560]EUC50498.1 hypothetical protein COCMIDRAFT_32317 [Bipolaris oryzae ATCC 44560]